MNIYEETYNAIIALPCVQKIIQKNKKLRKENKSLRNLIQSIPEFRQPLRQCHCSQPDTVPVTIKVEPTSSLSPNTKIISVNCEDVNKCSEYIDLTILIMIGVVVFFTVLKLLKLEEYRLIYKSALFN